MLHIFICFNFILFSFFFPCSIHDFVLQLYEEALKEGFIWRERECDSCFEEKQNLLCKEKKPEE